MFRSEHDGENPFMSSIAEKRSRASVFGPEEDCI